MKLKDKVVIISGASRGIGLAIAQRVAVDGAKVAILAKSTSEDPRIPGTIYSARDAVIASGGDAIAVSCDVREEAQVVDAVNQTVAAFGGIDIVVNCAGAIQLTSVEKTEMKRFDLMHALNARAPFMLAKHALAWLKKSDGGHILNMSPPINLHSGWLGAHLAYTMSKYGMSMATIALDFELAGTNVSVNSLWPETLIDTAAVRNLLGGDQMVRASRKPQIVADAAYLIFTETPPNGGNASGNFYIDSEVLSSHGQTDLTRYAVDPTVELRPDIFLGDPSERTSA
jgi:citronellol/citronellal dehydrogenase